MMPPFPLLPPRVYRYVMRELLTSLPPPMDADPQTREDRDVVVLAAVRRLYPINTTEARVAVMAVASQTQAMDCLRLAGLHGDDLKVASQCRAQAALMMRTSAAAMKELRALQAMRPSLPADLLEPEQAARRTNAEPAPMEAGSAERLPVNATPIGANPMRTSDGEAARIVGSPEDVSLGGAILAGDARVRDTRVGETDPTPLTEAACMAEPVTAARDGHGDRSASPEAPELSHGERQISAFRDHETESVATATDPAQASARTAPTPRAPVLAPLEASGDGHADPGDRIEWAEAHGHPIGPVRGGQSVTVAHGGQDRPRRGTETPNHRRGEPRPTLPGIPIGLRPSGMDGLAAEAGR